MSTPRFIFDVEPALQGNHKYNAVIRCPDGAIESLGQFDNELRAWLACKAHAAELGVSAGDPPWLRSVRVTAPRKWEF